MVLFVPKAKCMGHKSRIEAGIVLQSFFFFFDKLLAEFLLFVSRMLRSAVLMALVLKGDFHKGICWFCWIGRWDWSFWWKKWGILLAGEIDPNYQGKLSCFYMMEAGNNRLESKVLGTFSVSMSSSKSQGKNHSNQNKSETAENQALSRKEGLGHSTN